MFQNFFVATLGQQNHPSLLSFRTEALRSEKSCIFTSPMKHHHYYVYIVTNPDKTAFYTGVTNDIEQRLYEHFLNRNNDKTFAGKYHCYNLVYYEDYKYINNAIAREKEIKKWGRRKKMALIQTDNPELKFLNESICTSWPPPEDIAVRGS